MAAITLGLDIGGANLKAASIARSAAHWPFALWRHPEALAEQLGELIRTFPEQPIDRLAITMTGEMCDCYTSKREGVNRILDAVAQVANGRRVMVWLVGAGWCSLDEARRWPFQVAASNWHALASYVGTITKTRCSLLIDTGSTTTDIIPIVEGVPVAVGRNDAERMQTGELVYTGVGRTPICALLGERVMAELFATTLDAYLLLGEIAEDAEDTITADGRPALRAFAHARFARMLGGDAELTPLTHVQQWAREVFARQRQIIGRAMDRVCRSVNDRCGEWPETIIFSGAGEFLARASWIDYAATLDISATQGVRTISLNEVLGPEISQTACAYALAVLAER